MAFDWGSFAGGMAKTWNSGAIGAAINQSIAQGREEDAVAAATKKRDEAIKTLDAQRGGEASIEVKPTSALPTQAVNLGVDAVSSAGGNEMKPLSDTEYEARKAAIDNDFANAKKQARVDYFKFRGMDAERMKAEDELEQSRWHQGQVDMYKNVVAGDPKAVGKLVGYMNASMGDGSQIVQNDDGTMTLMGANGQPIQANFKPSLEQINSAFTNYYNTAKFFHDNDFEGMLSRRQAIQGMDLASRKDAREDQRLGLDLDKFDFDKGVQNEKLRQAWKGLGLDEAKLKQAAELFYSQQAFDGFQKDLDRAHDLAMQTSRQGFQASESEKGRRWKTGERVAGQEFTTSERKGHEQFQASESEKGRKWKTDERVAGQDFAKSEREAGQEFTKSEREESQKFKAGESAANRASNELMAAEDRKVRREGQAIQWALGNTRLAHDAANAKRTAALQAEELELRREEARARDAAAQRKAIDDAGLHYQRGSDGVHYGYSGASQAPVSYRVTPESPEIPIGMSEEDYAANLEIASKLGITYKTLHMKDGSARGVFVLPDGSFTDSATEAAGAMEAMKKRR